MVGAGEIKACIIAERKAPLFWKTDRVEREVVCATGENEVEAQGKAREAVEAFQKRISFTTVAASPFDFLFYSLFSCDPRPGPK